MSNEIQMMEQLKQEIDNFFPYVNAELVQTKIDTQAPLVLQFKAQQEHEPNNDEGLKFYWVNYTLTNPPKLQLSSVQLTINGASTPVKIFIGDSVQELIDYMLENITTLFNQ